MADQHDKYFTIEKPSTGIFKDKGSKFLSYAYPVKTDAEIKLILHTLKSQYFDARHHCYAYRLGADKPAFRANDDGEPSGTAGKPILGQIVSNDLTNILIAVVRYFGGTLLGTSGLINAYRAAAADVIAHASIIEKYVYSVYRLKFDYLAMNQVMKLVKDYELDTCEQDFGLACSMKLNIKLSNTDMLLPKFEAIENVKAEYLGLD
jgi:uncharacterized YigZ family protein